MRSFRYDKEGSVSEIKLSPKKDKVLRNLIENLYLIPTNKKRLADNVLKNFVHDNKATQEFLKIREIAQEFIEFEDEREYKIEELFHKCMRESWNIKKNMTGVMNEHLHNQFEIIEKIPNNWIRLIGAGTGGYFLISVKCNPNELFKIASDYNIKSISKASLTNFGVSALKV